MGKQARLKEKRRREEQLRAKGRRRAIAKVETAASNAISQFLETFESASLADRKAMDATVMELADQAAADPVQAALAMVNYRRIIAAGLPGHRRGRWFEPGELPNLTAKMAAAQAALYDSVATACGHLKPSNLGAAICIDEPRSVLCLECAERHGAGAGHPAEWDFQCLECGGVDLRGISTCAVPPLLGLPIRFGTEEQRFMSPVIVTGIGICHPCRLGVGKKRGRVAPAGRGAT